MTTTYPNITTSPGFFWTSIIPKVSVATLSMCLFAEKNIAQKLLLF